MNRDFKGVWIPKEIWLDKQLTWMEKIVITEINSLDGDEGCFASNNYFAKFFNLTPGRISQIISSLIYKKYISAEYIREGKEVIKRVVRILNTSIKNSKEGIKNSKEGYLENAQDNNTYINNTNNNTNKLFEKFWNLYDKKIGKSKSEKLWYKIKPELHDIIFKHIEEYKRVQPDKTFRKDPERYLRNECWNDEIINKPKKEFTPLDTTNIERSF